MAKTPVSPAARAKIRAFSNTKPRDGSLEAALDVGYRLGVIIMWGRMTLAQRREWMERGRELAYPPPTRKAA